MNSQTQTKSSAACPVCSAPRSEWENPEGFDGTYCCEVCADKAKETSSTAQARQNPSSTSSATRKNTPEDDRGNRPTQQRNPGSNVSNVDADRQRKSTGQPDSDAASRTRTGRE